MSNSVLRWSANASARFIDSAGLLPSRSHGARLRVLMYHRILANGLPRVGSEAVDAKAFHSQIKYLKRNFRLLHSNEIETNWPPPSGDSRPAVLLTFDDGIGNNATVAAPILEELQVPAVFFVSLRHTQPGQLLWFMHASALFSLCASSTVQVFGRDWPLASPAQRRTALNEFVAQSYKHPVQQIYDDLARYPVQTFVSAEVIERELRGMTEREIAAVSASRHITIGAHTVNHPYLTSCSDAELQREIAGSKSELERICGRPVTAFAYPDGDYDARVAAAVERAGFRVAFSVNERPAGSLGRMSIMRAGVYRGGLGLLAMKARGWGD